MHAAVCCQVSCWAATIRSRHETVPCSTHACCDAAGSSISWSAPAGCSSSSQQPKPSQGTHEVLQGKEGYKLGASRAQLLSGRAASRLCRASMLRQMQDTSAAYTTLAGQPEASCDSPAQCQGEGCAGAPTTGQTYARLKRSSRSSAYIASWRALRTSEHSPFRVWVDKPAAEEAFTLPG
jgi:hypothetical protein